MLNNLKNIAKSVWKKSCQSARLMVGIPDYEEYLKHMKECHPNHKIMSEAEFCKRATEMRYPSGSNGGKMKKCPC